uniref:Uncharacterized protein TCIL3000_11_15620 n=1 Tax=Trypanosoma congolense (strain IL3000) TaxID=1068625 RepID=G0V329_TRYCI|nr:unnamed protein product [Trypanosoma congolense IL3000]
MNSFTTAGGAPFGAGFGQASATAPAATGVPAFGFGGFVQPAANAATASAPSAVQPAGQTGAPACGFGNNSTAGGLGFGTNTQPASASGQPLGSFGVAGTATTPGVPATGFGGFGATTPAAPVPQGAPAAASFGTAPMTAIQNTAATAAPTSFGGTSFQQSSPGTAAPTPSSVPSAFPGSGGAPNMFGGTGPAAAAAATAASITGAASTPSAGLGSTAAGVVTGSSVTNPFAAVAKPAVAGPDGAAPSSAAPPTTGGFGGGALFGGATAPPAEDSNKTNATCLTQKHASTELQGKMLSAILAEFDKNFSKDYNDFLELSQLMMVRDRQIVERGNEILTHSSQLDDAIASAEATKKMLTGLKDKQVAIGAMLQRFEGAVETAFAQARPMFSNVDEAREKMYGAVINLFDEVETLKLRVQQSVKQHNISIRQLRESDDIAKFFGLIDCQLNAMEVCATQAAELEKEIDLLLGRQTSV